MIIYPAQNSTVMLVGALFLHSSFPQFVSGMSQSIHPNSYTMQWHRQISYSQSMGGEFHCPVYHPRQSASPENLNANSQSDHYQYIIPQSMCWHPGLQTQSFTAPGASGVLKTEDGNFDACCS